MKGTVFLVETFFNPEVELNVEFKKGFSFVKTKSSKQPIFYDVDHLVGASINPSAKHEFHVFTIDAGKKDEIIKKRLFRCQSATNAIEWVNAVKCVARNVDIGESIPKKLIFVLANPFGGKKQAMNIINNQVKPIFDSADIEMELKITERAGHATEIAETMDLSKYDGFVCCSGDGLLWEAIQGAMRRNDWRDVLKTPFGIIPAGSGNGLAKSLGIFVPGVAAAAISKGFARPIDLSAVRQLNDKGVLETWWSVLMLTWGILSDIDIESESIRWMGEPRFAVIALSKMVSRARYEGRVAFRPVNGDFKAFVPPCTGPIDTCNECRGVMNDIKTNDDDNNNANHDDDDNNDDDNNDEGKSSSRRRVRKKKNSSSSNNEQSIENNNNDEETSDAKKKNSLKKSKSSSSSSSTAKDTSSTQSTTTTNNTSTSNTIDSNDIAFRHATKVPGSVTGAALDFASTVPQHFDFDNPPDDWIVLDEKAFTLIVGLNAPYLAGETFANKHTHLSDGVLDLIVIPNPTRSESLSMLLGMDTGTSFLQPSTQMYRVSAFLFEPTHQTKKSIVDVDGEVLMPRRTSNEVYRGVIKMFAKRHSPEPLPSHPIDKNKQ